MWLAESRELLWGKVLAYRGVEPGPEPTLERTTESVLHPDTSTQKHP